MLTSEDAGGHVPSLEELTERVRHFARVRHWEQFHTSKNLAMALAGEVGDFWPSCSGSLPSSPSP